jgi:hypothetical protein
MQSGAGHNRRTVETTGLNSRYVLATLFNLEMQGVLVGRTLENCCCKQKT